MIIWITWTLWAGKWTIVDYLVKNKWFVHLSVRAYLIKEIKKRWMPVNRDSMVEVANDLRAKYWPSYIVEELYKEAKETGKNCIIESIRAEWEALALKWKDKFYLFSIDADPKIRYERVVLRWSETDKISFEEFIANEKREMENTDPTKQNLSKCMALSDHIFTNNWTFEELNEQISKVVEEFWI